MEDERIQGTINLVLEQWRARQGELSSAAQEIITLTNEQAAATESEAFAILLKLKTVPEDLEKIVARQKLCSAALELLARAQGADSAADALNYTNEAMQALQKMDQK